MAFGLPPKYSATRTISGDRDALLRSVRNVLNSLNWKYTERGDGAIEGRVGVSIWSWGERFHVELDGTSIRASSQSSFPLTVIDWGKNERNVHQFFDRLADERKSAI